MDTIKAYLFKTRSPFSILKKGRGGLLSLSPPPFLFPICAPVSVTEYASISLKNILAKSWINCSDYVKTLNMHDHLTCSTDFWRWLRFSISQSSEYGTVVYFKGYAEFRICLTMAPYASLIPEYILMFLNMPEHGWILLHVPEYAWINCPDYARVLNMPRHSYNKHYHYYCN